MSQDLIYQAFGEGANLYDKVLDVKSDASASELRKAYYRRALLFHPDKNPNDEEAKLKFQAVSLAYEILSDPARRKEYDEAGELYDEDDMVGGGVNQWEDYFRGLFKRVSVEDIDKFETEYKGSEEERGDVLKYYKASKGNLNQMLTCVMLSEEKDKKRWLKDFIMPAVKKGEVKHYKSMIEKTLGDCDEDDEVDDDDTVTDDDEGGNTKNSKKSTSKKPNKSTKTTQKRKKTSAAARKQKEAEEAEELMAKIRGNALARREKAFGSMIDGLEARYGGGKGETKKRGRKEEVMEDPIPDDAEFERIRAGLDEGKKKKKRRRHY